MLRESVVKIARLVTGMFIPGGKKLIENSIEKLKMPGWVGMEGMTPIVGLGRV